MVYTWRNECVMFMCVLVTHTLTQTHSFPIMNLVRDRNPSFQDKLCNSLLVSHDTNYNFSLLKWRSIGCTYVFTAIFSHFFSCISFGELAPAIAHLPYKVTLCSVMMSFCLLLQNSQDPLVAFCESSSEKTSWTTYSKVDVHVDYWYLWDTQNLWEIQKTAVF